jgi:DNA repair photolyase
MAKKKITGVQEWAKKSVNIQYGCQHGCKYCYAMNMARRFNRIPKEGWEHPILKWRLDLPKNTTVMFPSTHDICEDNIVYCLEIIGQLLQRNNKLLIVSKPHLECIKSICWHFKYDVDKIEFRFTIGSLNNKTLLYWEPNAPLVQERLDAIDWALQSSHKVSISCEPLLDIDCEIIDYLIRDKKLQNISEIWIGAMNNVKYSPNLDYQTIYTKYKDNPKIKFKESFRKHLSEGIL